MGITGWLWRYGWVAGVAAAGVTAALYLWHPKQNSAAADGYSKLGTMKVSVLSALPGSEISPALSPDGTRLAITRGDNVFVTQLPRYTPTPVDYTFEGGPFPTVRLTRDGGDFPQWTDARTLVWSNATRVDSRRPKSNQ